MLIVGDTVLVAPERVIFADSKFVYSAKPLHSISLVDGLADLAFQIPAHRALTQQISVRFFLCRRE